MSGVSKTKENSRLIAGVITIALAMALLVGTVVSMRQCAAQWPEPTMPKVTDTIGTLPSHDIGPTVAPNPYGPGDFAYQDGYLTCVSGESLLGVDVSEHQGQIDWQKVAESGVKFAMIRIGYRAWGSQGELHADVYGAENLKGAMEAGLQVGVYFFSQAISVEEAREEAQYVLSMLNGMALQLPVVFDWESISSEDARTNGVTRNMLNDFAMAFCGEIEEAGYEAMVYFNLDFAKHMYDLQAIQDAGYGFWLAMYSDTMNYAHKLNMWQYSNTGSVPGIQTQVDLNLYFVYFKE